MTSETMLEILSEHGSDAGSDYNDSDEVMGYFGWTVADGVLTITYSPEGDPQAVSRRWRLVAF